MKITDFFTSPGMFYLYASETEDGPTPYKKPILGATLEEVGKGEKRVSVVFSQNTRKFYPLDKKEDLITAGPSFIFKSEGSFYSIGPFEVSDVEDVFGGLPMTVPMMQELFTTSFRVMVENPESSDSLIEKIYIKKEDESFYVKSGKNWEEVPEVDESLRLVEISMGKGASIAKAIINSVPLAASQVNITPETTE
jgi:hypothetical protein